jgi:dihydroxyacetone kinase
MHAGFVGPGMLTAAAPGQVFASPSVDQVLNATRIADAGGGVVHIVKNYTGDRMNFALAAELAARGDISVATVVVDDDIAIERSDQQIGRRGTGATVLAEKIAGACAEAGGTLEEVREAAQRTVDRSASFGVALTSCSTPGGPPILQLGPDEIEVGVGIHGEAGRRRERIGSAAEIVDAIVGALLGERNIGAGAPVLAFVSGLGATPLIEQQLVFAELADRLRAAELVLTRSLVGQYVTSLDMAGVVVTLLELDPRLEQLWDAPVVTPGLRWGA